MKSAIVFVTAGVFLIFLVRRYLIWGASLLPMRSCRASKEANVAVLIAVRNEEARLDRCLAAIAALAYPKERLRIVLIDDASTDGSCERLRSWSVAHANSQVIALPARVGKGAALQQGMQWATEADVVAVFDADAQPDPMCLQLLCGALEDSSVGAAGARVEAGQAGATLVSRYAALERWTFHHVMLRGKDRMNSNPTVVGVGCAFRRTAIESIGGFPAGHLTEDLALSIALNSKGWKTRWVGRAVVHEEVVQTLSQFLTQRARWNRGMLESTSAAKGLEQHFVVAGYLDRVAIVASLALVAAGLVPLWIPALYLAAPGVSAGTALLRERVNPVPYVVAALPMFVADLWISARSSLAQLLGRPARWSGRAGD